MESSGQSTTIRPSHAVVGSGEETPIGNISGLSVVSLLLGLAAPLSLSAPLLWAIPLFGAAIAIVTMRQVAASDGALIGRRAAVIGLALSVASLCAAASRSVVSAQMVSHQARSTALEWLQLIASGDVASAFQYTLDGARGPAPPPPAELPEIPVHPHDPLSDLSNNPVVKYMASAGKDAQIQFDQDLSITEEPNGTIRVEQQFLVIPASGAVASPTTLHVTLERYRQSTLVAGKWLVSEYSIGKLPASARD
jgi:hypothetical protein